MEMHLQSGSIFRCHVSLLEDTLPATNIFAPEIGWLEGFFSGVMLNSFRESRLHTFCFESVLPGVVESLYVSIMLAMVGIVVWVDVEC